ncbi:hypothetical protein CpB0982 [Chlamydia pneumoniae TW-183]|uniref:Uncharacterized protein n=1 Tax=Chlamydia pneumoniae TaxID=83558 RepID=A0ABN3YRC5_CHLPN|nr:hypothetical protein CpB0982 [Chlamydia pneumoniae TW-183]
MFSDLVKSMSLFSFGFLYCSIFQKVYTHPNTYRETHGNLRLWRRCDCSFKIYATFNETRISRFS